MRAQFASFSQHIPLLYTILILNTFAITLTSFQQDKLIQTLFVPGAICTFSFMRLVWWLRQSDTDQISDAQISMYLKRTCVLAVVQTLAFTVWVIWVYAGVDAFARSNLTFFLALSQVSTVFCLMTLRVAALLVAFVSTGSFALYFSWVDDAQLLPQAIVLCCVCVGMAFITHGFNRSYYELIRSRRILRQRQLEAEKLSEENRRIAFTDALTGMPNRRELLARLDSYNVAENHRRDSLAVLFIDLDRFKEVNDQHGHQAGDELIVGICHRLSQQCPQNAVLARVGGDEFTVFLDTSDTLDSAQAQAVQLASRLLKEIALPLTVNRHVLQVGGSIGIAANIDSEIKPRELLRRADIAMYHAKTIGKDGVAIYTSELDAGRLRRLEIEAQIGSGLERGEFDLCYQPILSAADGRMVAAEALLRWPDRPEGPLPPDAFIEIAEATGQIHALGLYVLERACREILAFDGLKLSVNVSPAQFSHPAFDQHVLMILERTGFPAQRLQLEITESYLLADPDSALRAISVLKAHGISLALDDFGTGFTSIHYLRSYGFDHIKIDRSLVEEIASNKKAKKLVKGATMMAEALDIMVTAEGVESAAQADLLKKIGCHSLQGYFISKPMYLDKFRAFLGEGAAKDHRGAHCRSVDVAA